MEESKKIKIEIEYFKEQKDDLSFKISNLSSILIASFLGLMGVLYTVLYNIKSNIILISILFYIIWIIIFTSLVYYTMRNIKHIKLLINEKNKLSRKINELYKKLLNKQNLKQDFKYILLFHKG